MAKGFVGPSGLAFKRRNAYVKISTDVRISGSRNGLPKLL
jgi:hypothetical protein